MKKILLFVLLGVGCSIKSIPNDVDYNNYQPILLNNIEIDNLLNKKWLLKYYIIDEKVFSVEKEREGNFYIL